MLHRKHQFLNNFYENTKNLIGFILTTPLIGTILWVVLLTILTINTNRYVLAQSDIKESGRLVVTITSDYKTTISGEIVLKNKGAQPVAIDKYSFGLPFFQLNELKFLKISKKNVLVDTFVESNSTFFRIKSSKTDPIVLKKGQFLKFSFNANIRNGIKPIGNTLKVFYHPYIASPYTIELKVDKSLPNLSYYPYVEDKQYLVYDISSLLETQKKPILLFFGQEDLTLTYLLSTDASYVIPLNYRDCIDRTLIQSDSPYLYYDTLGYLLPKSLDKKFSSVLLKESVNLKCLKDSSFNSKNMYVGFFVNPINKTTTHEIWRFALGKLEVYNNNTFISSADKYGLFHIPVASCHNTAECSKVLSLLASNYNLDLIFNHTDDATSQILCSLNSVKLGKENDLNILKTFWKQQSVSNNTNECVQVDSIICNPIEILDDTKLLLTPHAKYNLPDRCKTASDIYINGNSVKVKLSIVQKYTGPLIGLTLFFLTTSILALGLFLYSKKHSED